MSELKAYLRWISQVVKLRFGQKDAQTGEVVKFSPSTKFGMEVEQ